MGEERGTHVANRKARYREALVMVKGGFLEKRLRRPEKPKRVQQAWGLTCGLGSGERGGWGLGQRAGRGAEYVLGALVASRVCSGSRALRRVAAGFAFSMGHAGLRDKRSEGGGSETEGEISWRDVTAVP